MSNHPDPMDRATELEELERQSALSLNRAAAERNRLRPLGTCYNCESDLDSAQQLFCDQDCREVWERRRAARVRNGTA